MNEQKIAFCNRELIMKSMKVKEDYVFSGHKKVLVIIIKDIERKIKMHLL